MSYFLTDNFLLQGKTAQKLYHDHVKSLPIIDYHCHLSPEEIATNKQFNNLTDIWLRGDHYLDVTCYGTDSRGRWIVTDAMEIRKDTVHAIR